MKWLKNMVIGLCIGSFCYLVIALFFVNHTLRMQMIGVMLVSAIMGVCTQIYQIKQLSLLMQTIIDLCIRYVSVISIGMLFGWFPFHFGAIMTATIIFIVLFLLFWTGFYLYERHQYQKFNRQKKMNP